MPRRLNQVCSIAGILSLTSTLSFFLIGCGKTGEFQFAVPDGKPSKILEFVKELRSQRPNFKSEDEKRAFTQNAQRALIEAGDKILAQKADDASLREAVAIKLTGTISRAAIQDRDSDEFTRLVNEAFKVVDELRHDKRDAVAQAANKYWVAARALNFKSLSSEDRTSLGEDALENVKNSPSSYDMAGEASYVVDQFAESGNGEAASSIASRLGNLLKDSTDQKIKVMAMQLLSKSHRLSLLGHPLELEGKLLNGDDLDWQSYRGKVVLVDFWATWCDPCVADLPIIKSLYDKYHTQGFDVIAISLDRSSRELENFVKAQALPWRQLFDEQMQVVKKQASPMAKKYNIATIPTAFLVDAQGKIVSVDAHAITLEPLLKKMIVDVAVNSESSAEVSAPSP